MILSGQKFNVALYYSLWKSQIKIWSLFRIIRLISIIRKIVIFLPIKTRKFLPPKDDLYNLLDEFIHQLKEKDILVITSKIVSIHQGRVIKAKSLAQKIQLIKQGADAYFPSQPHGLTLKNLTLTPYAGIDRSNANNHYVLWPKKPHQQAKKIWQYLKQKHSLKNLGVIIIDSF